MSIISTNRPADLILEKLKSVVEFFESNNPPDGVGRKLAPPGSLHKELERQSVHIKCLVDPTNVQMYTATGSIKIGDTAVETYRCDV